VRVLAKQKEVRVFRSFRDSSYPMGIRVENLEWAWKPQNLHEFVNRIEGRRTLHRSPPKKRRDTDSRRFSA